MSKHVVYSISSVLTSAYLHNYLKISDAWCPWGRVVSSVLCAIIALLWKPTLRRTHSENAGHQNARFDEHRATVSGSFQSGRILPVRAMTVSKNVLFCATWLYCGHGKVLKTDEFTLVFVLLVLAQTRFLKLLCAVISTRLLYKQGISIFSRGLYSCSLVLCTWLMRDPYVSRYNWIVFALFWVYIASLDSSPVCTSPRGAISPLLPLYIAISRFNARPIPLLLLAISPVFL